MRLSGIVKESFADGEGIRYVIFAQGCPHRCAGCHNPETWSFDGGLIVSADEIIADMRRNPLLHGLTISGGEPFSQASAAADVAQAARAAGYDVITYTGHTFETLTTWAAEDADVARLLTATDVLIDGAFIARLRSWDLPFRGSRNQRIIYLQDGMAQAPGFLG